MGGAIYPPGIGTREGFRGGGADGCTDVDGAGGAGVLGRGAGGSARTRRDVSRPVGAGSGAAGVAGAGGAGTVRLGRGFTAEAGAAVLRGGVAEARAAEAERAGRVIGFAKERGGSLPLAAPSRQ
jgi:hypothetical protein